MTTVTENKLAAAVASLSGLLLGSDAGGVSGALLFLKAQDQLSPAGTWAA